MYDATSRRTLELSLSLSEDLFRRETGGNMPVFTLIGEEYHMFGRKRSHTWCHVFLVIRTRREVETDWPKGRV